MTTSSTGVDGLEQLMDELVGICYSEDLSIESLQAKIKLFPSHHTGAYVHHYSSQPFLHAACMNKNVTLEIIEYILDAFPLIENLRADSIFCPEGTTTSYALHCACDNNHCPNEVIKLLIEKDSIAALRHFCLVGEGVQSPYDDEDVYFRGLPLHYYLARENVDIDTVKMFVEACPQTLVMMAVSELSLPAIHGAICNENINIDDLHDIIIFFLGQEQSSQIMRMVDGWNSTPLHRVCMKRGLTLELFQLVFNAWPEAIRLTDNYEYLPIHDFCCNKQLDDIVAIEILRFMLNIDPTLLGETNDDGCLPIHHAITAESTAFCKILIDEYPRSIMARARDGSVPIHRACRYGTRNDMVDTIQYLLELHPACIQARDGRGWLPIHGAAEKGIVKAIELLLMHDPTAASKETTTESRQLPLHIASLNGKIGAVQSFFDAFPEEILTRNGNGRTPIDLTHTRRRSNSKVLSFLKSQVLYARKAQDMTTMTTLDKNGWFPIHHALKDNVPLGSIKLLVKGNPSAVQTAEYNMALPLHIACEFSSVKVVKFLVDKYDSCVYHIDGEKDSILHYACRGGNLGVVRYLLESYSPLVASATVNAKGELPIHLLCEKAGKGEEEGDNGSTEYIETIWLLLLANPEVVKA